MARAVENKREKRIRQAVKMPEKNEKLGMK